MHSLAEIKDPPPVLLCRELRLIFEAIVCALISGASTIQSICREIQTNITVSLLFSRPIIPVFMKCAGGIIMVQFPRKDCGAGTIAVVPVPQGLRCQWDCR